MGSPEEAYREVLDATAGRGDLVRLLLDQGYEVAASDIVPEIFEVDEVECRPGNLNERLPYDDASFDAVFGDFILIEARKPGTLPLPS